METKIPFYNILNIFLTGFIFLGCIIIIFSDRVTQVLSSSLVTSLGAGPETIVTVSVFAIVYEIGLIINRLGSIVIEPLLKKIKLIPFDDDYKNFNNKKKEYPIMSTLSREYALSRTGITMFLLLAIIALVCKKWLLCTVFVAITFVYVLSCRKHATKIVKLMG